MNFAEQEALRNALSLADTYDSNGVVSTTAKAVVTLASAYLKLCQEHASIEDQLQEYLLTSDPY